MSIGIRGIGWVTPLGTGLDEVWQRLMSGETATVASIQSPFGKTHFYIPVPPKSVEHLGRTPRIRRSSAISYYTTAAGLSALANAGLEMTPEVSKRTAIIFAICSGGVNYTRRFYEKIVAEGASAASPLLFPETVYNAPASHLASILGIDGASYTLVGDATVGLSALTFAEELLATEPGLDQCVVVGGEECDWILCEAYHTWRLTARTPEVKLHQPKPTGMMLSEGAAALVVDRNAPVRIENAPAISFTNRAKAEQALSTTLAGISSADAVIGSANGTWIDNIEARQLQKQFSNTPAYFPKAAIGDALGASSLMQVLTGALALNRCELPPADNRAALLNQKFSRIAVAGLGLNQQAAGCLLVKE